MIQLLTAIALVLVGTALVALPSWWLATFAAAYRAESDAIDAEREAERAAALERDRDARALSYALHVVGKDRAA
jgi:hypothetical protein